MDHNTAESLQAVERYTLDELSEQERDQFEEHLFDCPICSEQVRRNFIVTENLKQVLIEDSVRAANKAPNARNSWRDWLRLPSLVPTLATLALAGVLVYQNTGQGTGMQVARVLPAGSILMPVSRGESAPTELVNPKLSGFVLTFSVDAARPDSFVCEFDNAAGKKILELKTDAETSASFNLPVQLPTALFPPGHYQMILRPASEPDSIKSYPFAIENTK